MPAYAHRMDGITGSAIRELFKLLSKGDIISFGGGNPSSSSFPVEQVKEITDYLLNEKAEQMLQYGAVTTPAGLPLAARLVQLERDMEELIAQLRPEAIAVEELFFSNNITTGIAVAHARGVVHLRCGHERDVGARAARSAGGGVDARADGGNVFGNGAHSGWRLLISRPARWTGPCR